MKVHSRGKKIAPTIGLAAILCFSIASCSPLSSSARPGTENTPDGTQERADLQVSAPTVSDSRPLIGAPYSLSVTVSNAGTGPAGSITVRYYQSTDGTITSADTQVAEDTFAGLAAEAGVSVSAQLHAPMSPGTYFVGACAEAHYDESDTTNICSAAYRVTVQTSVQAPSGQPDLKVVSPLVSNEAPAAGARFALSATVANRGAGHAPATLLRYYRSADATITALDTQLDVEPVSVLAGSGSIGMSTELTAPETGGAYYFGACVDAVAQESDTTNNCSPSIRVEVLQAVAQTADLPDLVVETAAVSDDSCVAGTSVTLSTTVRNRGAAQSTPTTLRYYWSTDATITTSDTAAGTDTVEALEAAGTSSGSAQLTAPAGVGTHYYGACVDPVAGESDTSNNCSASRPYSVIASDAGDDPDGTRAGAVDLGDITDNTSTLAANARVSSIGGPGDRVDYYRFTLSEEKRVEVVLRTVHRTDTSTDLFLEDDTGGVLLQQTDTVTGAIRLSGMRQAGTYYVRLQDDSGCLSIHIFGYEVSN